MLGTAAPSATAPALAFFWPLPRRSRGLVWGVSSSSVKMPSQGKGPADQTTHLSAHAGDANSSRHRQLIVTLSALGLPREHRNARE